MDMTEILKKLISIESIAEPGVQGYPYGPGPAKALAYMLSVCEKAGFTTAAPGGKYGYAEIGEGSELIGILCHLDVVPAGSGWKTPAFEASVRDGRIYGRGAVDDKGPAVAVVAAMKDLLDSRRPIGKRIRIIFGQMEETGSWIDIDKYKKKEELPDLGFTPDSQFPAVYGEKGAIIVSVKMPKSASGLDSVRGGSAPNMVPDCCEAVVHGAKYSAEGSSAHGSTPWDGDNAISKMMNSISEEYSDGSVPFADLYCRLFSGDHYGKKSGIACEDNGSGKLTVNPGMIEENGDDIELLLDIRYPVTADADIIVAGIDREVSAYGATASESFHMNKIFNDPEGSLVQALVGAYREVTGDCSDPIVVGGGSYAHSMDNIVAFGPVMPGQEMTEHMANEYIEIEQLSQLREIYRRAIENLLDI
jgi:succinyl-diaminopimelate desuccinylase